MASENFAASLTHVFRHEGGYVDHPLDPGGSTNRGITRATLAAHRGRPVSKAEVMTLSAEEAASIYRKSYWDAVKADELPSGLDLVVFDAAVNSGPARAVRWLQQALGLAADGVMGARTLAAARARDAPALIASYSQSRLGFLQRLSTWRAFGRGWGRRVREVERAALTMARTARTAKPAAPSHGSQPRKDKSMDKTKTLLASRTLWANTIGLAAVLAGALGFDTSAVDAPGLAEAATQGIAAVSFIASSVFRILATRQLATR
jgi:lysozyme family protein